LSWEVSEHPAQVWGFDGKDTMTTPTTAMMLILNRNTEDRHINRQHERHNPVQNSTGPGPHTLQLNRRRGKVDRLETNHIEEQKHPTQSGTGDLLSIILILGNAIEEWQTVGLRLACCVNLTCAIHTFTHCLRPQTPFLLEPLL
jgi:hypothetical protein